MKIAVFGSTGGTGQELVRQALYAGHQVTVLARDPAKLNLRDERLSIVQGDVTDAACVDQIIAGVDAVISALGPTRISSPEVMQIASANIIAAMKRHNVHRLVWQTGAGVQDAGDAPSAIRALMVTLMKIISPTVLEDSQKAFQYIKQSGLAWTVVRVPRLKDGAREGGIRASLVPPGPTPISRADAADFLLKQLTDETFIGKAPMLGK